MDCGLPVIEKLVNFSPFLVRIILCNSLFFKAHCYHLEAPGPVPRLAPGQLAHVAEDGGGLGQGHVTVHQNWDLLERKLGPFPVFSPNESILCPWLTVCQNILSLTWRAWCWPPRGGWQWTSAATGWSGRDGRCDHQTALLPTLPGRKGNVSESRIGYML